MGPIAGYSATNLTHQHQFPINDEKEHHLPNHPATLGWTRPLLLMANPPSPNPVLICAGHLLHSASLTAMERVGV